MPKLSGLTHGTECTICDISIENTGDDQYVAGYFGLIPVVFCLDCYRMTLEMAAREFGLLKQDETLTEGLNNVSTTTKLN